MLLSILIATMAVLSAVMLGMGQGNLFLPGITAVAAIASVLLTDAWRWFRLNRYVANAAMLLAAFFALNNFLPSDSRQQLVAVGNLLIYVQIVLLFREKSRRIFGQLTIFSLLQVVVASLLNDRLEFGLLLLVYMIVSLSGFAVIFVQRETARVGEIRRRRAAGKAREASGSSSATWLLGDPPSAQVVDSADVLYTAVVNWKFVGPISAMAFATVVFAVVFFYITPRTGGAHWASGTGIANVVGFSPEISFDRMGQVLQNDERVMRVSFKNARTGEPYTVIGDPYFRGSVLTKYISYEGHGQWRQEIEATGTTGVALASPPSVRDLVRQDVLLEPTGNRLLFSVFPVYAIGDTPGGLTIGPRTRRLYRMGGARSELYDEYRFCIASTAFRFGQQIEVAPHANKLATERDKFRMELLHRKLRFIDSRSAFPKLIALAEKIVREEAADGNNYDRARALERHFLEPEQYHYSLDLDGIKSRRQEGVDPIEDFVSNHRTGHCEYFASALTLMLRSQGIPARMIIGYKGGEYNYVGSYYVVRQSDAHAWVEAYLKPEEIPADTLYDSERHAGGGWLRLDPTPASDEQSDGSQRGVLDRMSMSFDYARWLWNDYVLRLSADRQQKSLIDPLALDSKFPLAELFSASTWKEWINRISGTDLSALVRGQFSWRAGAAAVVACAAAYAGYRLVRFLAPLLLLVLRRRGQPSPARRQRRIAFYRQFESLLARLGLRRDAAQTPREFARVAAECLVSLSPSSPVASVPDEIVDAFYQVRYGHHEPDSQQQAQIESQLNQLRRVVNDRQA